MVAGLADNPCFDVTQQLYCLRRISGLVQLVPADALVKVLCGIECRDSCH